MSKAKSAKSKAVSVLDFVKGVIAGRKAGKSNAEIAKALGMQTASFGVRLATTNRDMRNATAQYQVEGEATPISGEVASKRFKIKIADLQTDESLKAMKATVSAQGKTLPGASGVPRTRTNWGTMAAELFNPTADESAPADE